MVARLDRDLAHGISEIFVKVESAMSGKMPKHVRPDMVRILKTNEGTPLMTIVFVIIF